ncbi:MAG TPA: hypothetical protein VEY91_00985 [Candidatus Limnocylindria bacterium]|nr:hypothetical protein [Candidatus Limnocylindria bacterium]
MRRRLVSIGLSTLLLASVVWAASAKEGNPKPAPSPAAPAAADSGVGAQRARAATPRAGARAAKGDSARSTAARKPARSGDAGARRLDEIHIEGEIPVPQVLFITAREQRRIMDFKHRRFQKTGRAIGESTVLPSRIAVVGNTAPEPGKGSR